MFLDYSFGDGETQASPSVFACFDLIEFLKDFFRVTLRDANTGVSNFV
jgi:hypothetical protein